MATHSRILAWRIPWTEEPGRPQSIGLQRVAHDLATKQQHHLKRTATYWVRYLFKCYSDFVIRNLKKIDSKPHYNLGSIY